MQKSNKSVKLGGVAIKKFDVQVNKSITEILNERKKSCK